MFKNATIYKINGAVPFGMAAAMDSAVFTPCGESQDLSIGWVPPRGIYPGALMESVGQFRVVTLAIETKSVPASEIDKLVKKEAKRYEEETGHRLGKKALRELKEDAYLALLPKAFPKRKDVHTLITKDFVVIDTASSLVAEHVVAFLARAGLTLELVTTVLAPSTYMKNCLLDEENAGAFFIGRACDMVANDESGSKVSFKDHYLMSDNVREHIAQGKEVTKLALDGGTVAFEMTSDLVLKKLHFETPESADGDIDGFEADVVLVGSAIESTIKDLIHELGGLVKSPVAQEEQAA